MTNEELLERLESSIYVTENPVAPYNDRYHIGRGTLALIQSFREQIQRETVEKCQDVINEYTNTDFLQRKLDQLKQHG